MNRSVSTSVHRYRIGDTVKQTRLESPQPELELAVYQEDNNEYS